MRRQVELALASVGIVAAAAAGWAGLIRPQTNEASAAVRRETAALATAEQLRREIAERRDLQHQASALEERVKALDKLFPNRPQVAELTEALQTIADQAGVQLSSIQPGTPTRGANADQLARIPVQLTVGGGYFQIADFLSRLETLTPTNAAETGADSRAVLVTTVSLTRGGDAVEDAEAGVLEEASGNLTASVAMYAFQSVQDPAAQQAQPGTGSQNPGGAGATQPAPATAAGPTSRRTR